MPRRLWPVAAAGAAAVVGLVLLGIGLLVATVGAAPTTETLRLRPSSSAGAVLTAPGVLELRADRVQVRASAQGRRVVLAIARTADAEAFLGRVPRLQITGRAGNGDAATVTSGDGDDKLPDPARSDAWAVSSSGTGSVDLAWASRPGRWSLVAVAVDSAGAVTAPEQVELTWRPAQGSSPAVALIAIGLLLLVAGGVAVAVIQLQRRTPLDDFDDPADPAELIGSDGAAATRPPRQVETAIPAAPLTSELPVVPAGAVVSSRRAARAAREAEERAAALGGRRSRTRVDVSDPRPTSPEPEPEPAAVQAGAAAQAAPDVVPPAGSAEPLTSVLPLGRHRTSDLFGAQPLPGRRPAAGEDAAAGAPDAPPVPARPFRFDPSPLGEQETGELP